MEISNKRTINLTASESIDFFTIWVNILSPFLKISTKEIVLLAALLRKRQELLEKDGSDKLANLLLFTTEVRREVRDSIKINQTSFNNSLALLKKKGYINKDNIINSLILPNVDLKKGKYVFSFDINLEMYEGKKT